MKRRYIPTLPPRPRLVLSIDPSRLTERQRQAIEALVIEWDLALWQPEDRV